MVEQEAPVGASRRLVGIVIHSEKDPAAGGKSQRFQEEGELIGAGGTLDELGDFGTDEDDGLPQGSETLQAEVLKGESDDLVIEPVRSFQQGHVRAPQQAVPVAQHHRIHPPSSQSEQQNKTGEHFRDSCWLLTFLKEIKNTNIKGPTYKIQRHLWWETY